MTDFALTIGNFDGVHLGHQELIRTTLQHASSHPLGPLTPAVVTFEPHPAKVLSPQVAPALIMPTCKKLALIKSYGISTCITLPFDKALAHMSPRDFFDSILIKKLKARCIVVGHDFSFGYKRTGTTHELTEWGQVSGIDVHIVPPVFYNDMMVSSTAIRKLVSSHNFTLATQLLTRPFALSGTVVSGHKRGSILGLHTANLKTDNELLPPDGVYATWVTVNGKRCKGATNVGKNPTFDNIDRSIETHIIDFDGNVYGQTLTIEFIDFVRDEIRFTNPQALVSQIQNDLVTVKQMLEHS